MHPLVFIEEWLVKLTFALPFARGKKFALMKMEIERLERLRDTFVTRTPCETT